MSRAGRLSLIVILLLLVAGGAVWFFMERREAALWRRMVVGFPGALQGVPVVDGREPPRERYRKACAVLARECRRPPAEVEERLPEAARSLLEESHPPASSDWPGVATAEELEEEWSWRSPEAAATLVELYLSPVPEDPATLEAREKCTGYLGPHVVRRLAKAAMATPSDEACEQQLAELRAIFALRRATQGKGHPKTLGCGYQLANHFRFMGRFREYESLAREVSVLMDLLPENGVKDMGAIPYILREELAGELRRQGRGKDEEAVLRAWLAASEGDRHWNGMVTADALVKLAECLERDGRNAEAWPLARRAADLERENQITRPRPVKSSRSEPILRRLAPYAPAGE